MPQPATAGAPHAASTPTAAGTAAYCGVSHSLLSYSRRDLRSSRSSFYTANKPLTCIPRPSRTPGGGL